MGKQFNIESGAADTYRDQGLPEEKFEKLTNMKKNTRRSLCPPEVRSTQ